MNAITRRAKVASPGTYPVFLILEKRPCLVVGGGAVAQRKIRSLLSAGARVTCVAERAVSAIRVLAKRRKITFLERKLAAGADLRPFLKDASLVIAATNSRGINRMIFAECLKRDILVNSVDDLELSNFIVPAVIRRGPLCLAVSTGGGSPEFAKRIRQDLEKIFGREHGDFIKFMAAERKKILSRIPSPMKRKKLFRALARSKLLKYFKGKDPVGASAHYRKVLEEQGVFGYFQEKPPGKVISHG